MKSILKSLFGNLFPSEQKKTTFIYKIKKGIVKEITFPDLKHQNNFVLNQWNYKVGDVIKYGSIVCELENENSTIEIESFLEGRLVWCCEKNIKASDGMLLFKLEGI